MSSSIGLWMIHGNLQTPKIWQPLQAPLTQAVGPDLNVSTVLEDLWTSPAESLQEWAVLFCQQVQTHPILSRFLLGYSLGGRLALHALLQQPELWQGAIIVSADPGLDLDCDRKSCLARDQQWSHKFLYEPWDDLWQQWNALPVFCGRQPTYSILETEIARTQIAKAFQNFSKAHQDNLLPQLQRLDLPILYISGEDDRKYCQIGQMLTQNCPTLTHQIIANSGHRVPWENPDAFLLAIHQFLDQYL